LKDRTSKLGLKKVNLDLLNKQLSDTPPSLYIFDKYDQPWNKNDFFQNVEIVNLCINNYDFFYSEYFDQSDSVYRRSIPTYI